MSTMKAQTDDRTDSVGMKEMLGKNGVWGIGLIGGDLIHTHRITADKYLAIFGKTWKDVSKSGSTAKPDVRATPSAYLLDTGKRSKTPFLPAGLSEPSVAPDLEGVTVIGAASQGSLCHVLFDTETPTLRTYIVTAAGLDKKNELYLHPVELENGKTVRWNRGISSNGSQIYVFGANEDNQIYLSKRDTINHTPFMFLAQYQWSGKNEELFPLMANGRPLQAQGTVSMMCRSLEWVIARTFGKDTTFWSTKHPRMGWKLASDVRETGDVRFHQSFSSVSDKSCVPYSVSREGASEFTVDLKNFELSR